MKELIGFHTRITKELKEELTDYCKKEGRSTQFVIEKALEQFFVTGVNQGILNQRKYEKGEY